jgi:hypothetical protein
MTDSGGAGEKQIPCGNDRKKARAKADAEISPLRRRKMRDGFGRDDRLLGGI